MHLTAGPSGTELCGTATEGQEEEYPLQDPLLYLLPPTLRLNEIPRGSKI